RAARAHLATARQPGAHPHHRHAHGPPAREAPRPGQRAADHPHRARPRVPVRRKRSMMKPRTILAAGGVCLAVALGAVGWLSAELLRLERAEAAARRQAAVESGTRLALWRMDAAMAPILASEGAGPAALVRCRFV